MTHLILLYIRHFTLKKTWNFMQCFLTPLGDLKYHRRGRRRKKNKTERREILKLRREREQAEKMRYKGLPNLKSASAWAIRIHMEINCHLGQRAITMSTKCWQKSNTESTTRELEKHPGGDLTRLFRLKQDNKLITTVTLFTWKRLQNWTVSQNTLTP